MRIRALDGLRGWGAVFVVLYHVFVEGLPVSAGSAGLLKRLIPSTAHLPCWCSSWCRASRCQFVISPMAIFVRGHRLLQADISGW